MFYSHLMKVFTFFLKTLAQTTILKVSDLNLLINKFLSTLFLKKKHSVKIQKMYCTSAIRMPAECIVCIFTEFACLVKMTT